MTVFRSGDVYFEVICGAIQKRDLFSKTDEVISVMSVSVYILILLTEDPSASSRVYRIRRSRTVHGLMSGSFTSHQQEGTYEIPMLMSRILTKAHL